MKRLIACLLRAGLLGAVTASAAAAPNDVAHNTAARVAAFAKLPNWMGFWEQFDIGASGKPGADEVRRATAGPPPRFTPEWQQHMTLEHKHNPETDRVCTFGFPTLLESSPLIFEIISVPEETAMIFNMRETRHIYTDGKGHTPADERLVTPWGDSVGHWEGQTLYIETVSTNGLFRFHDGKGQMDSSVLNEGTVYKERLRMLDANTLEDNFTVDDPQVFSEPYQFTRRYHRIPTMTRAVEELDCEATGTNDRNPIVDGHWTVSPPQR
jgi:hypothetical protein